MRALLSLFLLALCFARPAAAAVDINSAEASELESLPGIGPSKAAAIVQYRTDHGPFKTVDELDNVSGIGPSTLASLRDAVTVGKGSAAAPAKGAASTPASPAAAGATVSAPPSAASGCPVNINTADVQGLDTLPGIGESKAIAILQYRTDNGPYASCDGLDNVSGIGEATLAGLRDCCVAK